MQVVNCGNVYGDSPKSSNAQVAGKQQVPVDATTWDVPREPDKSEFGNNPGRQKRGRKSNLMKQSRFFWVQMVQNRFCIFRLSMDNFRAKTTRFPLFVFAACPKSAQYWNLGEDAGRCASGRAAISQIFPGRQGISH